MDSNKSKSIATKHQQQHKTQGAISRTAKKPLPVMVKESWNPRGDTARLKKANSHS
ncbi:MAG: hypothetical protein K0R14_669 [Burkholderiales bacterium]|jgi:hypothetical protein|nr:hypothetical protein [Burkholderiales bacterium]